LGRKDTTDQFTLVSLSSEQLRETGLLPAVECIS